MKINRLRKIQELLEEKKSISINDLCTTFDVSKNTIRRDIAELEKRGTISKVYGGIVLQEQEAPKAAAPVVPEDNTDKIHKQNIARMAASLVQDDDVIYIDSGTTTMHMMPYLEDKHNITIVTASINVINIAATSPKFNIIATGGTIYAPTKAFVGPSVLNCLKQYNISKIFISSTGISIENGLTTASPLECDIKRYLVDKQGKKILMVDSTKIDASSLISFCNLDEIDCIVVDKELPARYKEFFAEHNVEVIVCEN
ncbi:Transcriptional repressor of the myo-inositol catabolic operon DeoR family [Anaerovibrio sp. JC8]|uniref:DeoR/GlpR family DNA-binding transcription regulator n=1 Tax=Anaerovibrio sp. JC8 TaxID=1240085 RepID=UPI000A0D5ACB|nr:DeoR/GlpR family DNA-binding transcription regulator [Anaerovibrio sp. JC8]ORT98876.1 Transcriptional repressor of the myo-inositol catabolic operon DeoR family [Anaerovibrio sp. JC8]